MANFTSLELTPPTYPVSGVGLGGRTVHYARAQIALPATLAANDTIQLFDIPTRSRIVPGAFIKSDDLDSGTAMRLNVGITGTPALFFSASTSVANGTVDTTLAFAGTDYVTAGKTRVFATVSVAPTGSQAGNLIVMIPYVNEEPA